MRLNCSETETEIDVHAWSTTVPAPPSPRPRVSSSVLLRMTTLGATSMSGNALQVGESASATGRASCRSLCTFRNRSAAVPVTECNCSARGGGCAVELSRGMAPSRPAGIPAHPYRCSLLCLACSFFICFLSFRNALPSCQLLVRTASAARLVAVLVHLDSAGCWLPHRRESLTQSLSVRRLSVCAVAAAASGMSQEEMKSCRVFFNNFDR